MSKSLKKCTSVYGRASKYQTNTLMINRILIFGALFLGIFSQTLAQTEINRFENGLYISFEDLIGNRAVKDLPYRQDLKSSKDGVSRYEIFYQGSYKKVKRIYCFVNNDHIYLNSNEYGRKGYFIRSHFTGRYSYFEDRFGNEKFSGSRGVPSSNGPAVESKIWGVLLDMKTGKVRKATRRTMKKLLSPYPDLWQQYKDGDKTSTEVKGLIVWLNKELE